MWLFKDKVNVNTEALHVLLTWGISLSPFIAADGRFP